MTSAIFRRSFATVVRAGAVALALAALPAAGPAYAADELQQGAKVGQPIPHPLTAHDQANRPRDFRSMRGKKGLILLFNRSFEW